jgi:hypothetical protein
MTHPEITPIIMGHEPVLANALLDTSAWCDLKDCKGVLITVSHYRGGDTDLVLDVHEGDTAAGTTQVANNFQIWTALNALVDPTMVRQADAKTYTINTGDYTGSQVVCFYLDASACKRYVQLGAADGNVGSIVSVTYTKVGARYKGNESY